MYFPSFAFNDIRRKYDIKLLSSHNAVIFSPTLSQMWAVELKICNLKAIVVWWLMETPTDRNEIASTPRERQSANGTVFAAFCCACAKKRDKEKLRNYRRTT